MILPHQKPSSLPQALAQMSDLSECAETEREVDEGRKDEAQSSYWNRLKLSFARALLPPPLNLPHHL